MMLPCMGAAQPSPPNSKVLGVLGFSAAYFLAVLASGLLWYFHLAQKVYTFFARVTQQPNVGAWLADARACLVLLICLGPLICRGMQRADWGCTRIVKKGAGIEVFLT